MKISTAPDHQHCGVLRYGAPFRAGHVIEEGTVGEVLIKLKSADGKEGGKQAVRFGDTVRFVTESGLLFFKDVYCFRGNWQLCWHLA